MRTITDEIMEKVSNCSVMSEMKILIKMQEEKWNLKFFLQNRPDLAEKLQKGQTCVFKLPPACPRITQALQKFG